MMNSRLLQEIVTSNRWSVVSGQGSTAVHRLLFTVYCLLITLFISGCAKIDDTWQHLQNDGVPLRVGIDPTYPPFAVADSNDVWGLDVDLARAIGEELDVPVQFVYFGFDGLYDALLTEQVDVLISALVVNVGRTGDFAYSDPYFNAGEVLVVRAAESEIKGWRDLNGRILAVELGSQGHMEANRWARRLADLTVQSCDTPDAALQAVALGQSDAALIDNASARLFQKENPSTPLQRLPDPVTVQPYAMVVRKTDQRLLNHLNDSLEQLQKSGQLDVLLAKWLGE